MSTSRRSTRRCGSSGSDDGHDTVIVNGHSTGGLIAALWAHRVRGRGLIQGLFLNSPFFEFNEPWLVRQTVARLVNLVGARRPLRKLPQELGATYGRSIHIDHHGEWAYDLAWKPIKGYPVYAAGRARSDKATGRSSADSPSTSRCSSRARHAATRVASRMPPTTPTRC